ncbi:PDZ domain-containing protein [Rhodobacterales bacterium HKCCE2091]|nr:PDZ domain-containing protein [Rhodobacterales bacterium HKCCE2091]
MTATTRSPNSTRLAAAGLAAVLVGTSALATLPAEAQAVPEGGYVDLVARVSPAVVTIETEAHPGGLRPAMDEEEDGKPGDMGQMQETPRGQIPGFPNMPRIPGMPNFGEMPTVRAAGTGFVIAADGLIVTNAHVVENADTLTVTLDDGTTYDAEVVGLDAATDIAVLRIEAEDLPVLEFGSSEALRVGEPVVAVGNPFGLGNTVTTGIVSALGRDINAGPYVDFIQTDAAINMGNSGGPLLNEAGEVVGVNTAIVSPTGGSIGLGFSVPSDIVADVVADLSEGGAVTRGFLGVQIQPVSEEVAAALGREANAGAMVTQVSAGTPAEDAGLRRGDIVLAVDGTEVGSPRDLTRLIAADDPGETVTLTILRAGEQIEVEATLASRDQTPA